MTERAPKPYTAPDGKTRLARGPSEHAAAIESAGANIADALRTLPSADSWESLRLAVKHHGQGTEAAGERIADAIETAASSIELHGSDTGEALDRLADAVAGAGNAQSEALSEFLAPAVDHLADAVTGAADGQAAAQRHAAEWLRDGLDRIAAGLHRIGAALEDRPA